MKKRVIAVFLMLGLLFAFNACAGSTAIKEEAIKEEATTEESTVPEEVVEEEATDYDYTIGVTVMDQANSFWTQYLEPMEAWGVENNVEILYNDGQGSAETQIAAVENWINMGVDAIVINPMDTVALSTVSQMAADAGIVVVASFYAVDGYDAWLSADQYQMGYTVGKAVGEWVTKTYGDVEVQWASTNADTISSIIPRREGMEAAMAEFAPGSVLVGTGSGMTAEEGMEIAESLLQAYPDLKVFIGTNDSSALGALEAFKAAGKTGDGFCIAGVDASDDAISEMVKEGTIFRFTVNQDPRLFGKGSLDYALKALKGETFEKDVVIPVSIVDETNLSDFVK